MELYKVGKDDLGQYDLYDVDPEKFEWLVYSYDFWGQYEGDGEAVALGKDGLLYVHDMSHCSCYGPMDQFGNKGTMTVEEFLREKDDVHDYQARDEVESKVRMLLDV